MGTFESLIVGYIIGLVVSIIALLLVILIFLDGGRGELGGTTQSLFDIPLSYFNSNPNAFLIGFLLGVTTTVGGGTSSGRSS